MADLPDNVIELLSALRRDVEKLERKIDALAAKEQLPHREALALTKKHAARILGVDHKTTLEQMIEDGRLRTTMVNGAVRIERSEIERALREGIPAQGPRPAKRRGRAPRRPARSALPPPNTPDLIGKIPL